MGNTRASRRYATALLGAAVERNELEAVGKDLDILEGMITSTPEFARFLRSPVISKERKKRALRELLTGRVGGTTAAFSMLLASKDREGLLPEIISQFRRLRDERLGVLDVVARSAAAFTPAQEQSLAERLGRATGKTVRLRVERDPSLIAGFTVQYDDTVWDASVRRQLELLRERLAGGN